MDKIFVIAGDWFKPRLKPKPLFEPTFKLLFKPRAKPKANECNSKRSMLQKQKIIKWEQPLNTESV